MSTLLLRKNPLPMDSDAPTLLDRALGDPDMHALTFRMRDKLRGRNVGELIGFDEQGRMVACRLLGYTNSGAPVSSPTDRENTAAYLFRGCTSLIDVAGAVVTRHEWAALAAARDATVNEEMDAHARPRA